MLLEPEADVYPGAEAVACTVYFPAVFGVVQLNCAVPVRLVVPYCVEIIFPDGSLIVRVTLAPATATPEDVTVTVILTAETFV